MIEHIRADELREGDIERMHEIEKLSFSQPWTKESLEDSFKNSSVKYFKAVLYSADGIEGRDILIGFIGVMFAFDEAEIINLAVDPEYRRNGAGRTLVLSALKWCAERKIRNVFLEVRRSNTSAIELYRTVGFDELGIRRGYYSFPTEDAIVMKLELF